MKTNEKKRLWQKRIIALVSLFAVAVIFFLIAYFVIYKFLSIENTAESFKDFIEGYGIWGRGVALGIQFLQVFIAIIPGEFVEVGLGMAFGYIEGTILCYIGVALASTIVFLIVKKFGIKAVELFVDPKKIDQLKFINSEKKLYTLVFLLFLIPGTPKDLLTYVVPLTRIKLSEFLTISLLARIPSVISSIIGGDFFSNGKYLEGIFLFLITGAVSLLGMIIYRAILNKKALKKEP
ncbi:MAG: TVP38/TMEM64 family protein [Ruminococcaceae bacterium]|nr:TVP38/TMEM64 family protein [Oscillospiraceae bacterium]